MKKIIFTAFFVFILSFLSYSQNTTNNEGDTYIDIDINVDELANDYDVDEVAERVQEIIDASIGTAIGGTY